MRQRGRCFIVRVFERFSLTDRDLVSLSLLLADLGDGRIRLHRDHRRLRQAGEAMDLWARRPF